MANVTGSTVPANCKLPCRGTTKQAQAKRPFALRNDDAASRSWTRHNNRGPQRNQSLPHLPVSPSSDHLKEPFK